MPNKILDFWAGLFVTVGAIALLFLALQVSNLNSASFAESYAITARFDNIGGLKMRAPVKSAGVVVGRVKQILFDDRSFQAKVILDINKTYKFPRDSSAKILTAGLLGEQYISIEPGGDLNNLTAGDQIKLTQSAIVLENIISQFLYSKVADGSKE